MLAALKARDVLQELNVEVEPRVKPLQVLRMNTTQSLVARKCRFHFVDHDHLFLYVLCYCWSFVFVCLMFLLR